ncbi:uncharacterized protein K02A2.6-like [Toxorhynchites rutilus septentrionalis]|uniref:uncharacterized protein K02A2.6-like n=1 Tax=Toxorhynchites rutilus septentrionalis TaxID=329112 RepID=UPI00247ACACA|nr:uncharacterized protein K02A2.6-like [Toxorhynchites rutilus septentrionalis]
MADADLKQAILRLTDLIANQQQQIAALQQGNANQVGSEKIIESLSTGIDEFQYDPDGGIFFDSWYARYEDVFKEDGKHLDDKAKVRLLLRKIGTQFHERYVNSVLPSHPRDFSFEDTVKKLKKLFGRQKSLFNARYQCLQYVKNEVDDFSSYSASVNKHCEAFQIGKLSSDQFKTLRFVCGLQSPRDSDIRTRLIGKLEAEENAPPADGANLKLENLVEECNRIINLKQDTQMIEKGCTDKSKVNAISRHRTSNGKEKKSPKTPCWFCGDLHYVKECPYQTHTCSKCKRKGHKEGYCSSSEKKPTKQIDKPKPKDIVKSKGIAVKRVDLKAKRKFVKIDINGVPAKLQLDCASDITIISKRTWTSVGKPVTETTDVAAVSASGDGIDIVGEFNAEITIQDVTKVGRIFVTSNPDLNVLGIETIDQFDLWSVPFSSLVNSIQQNSIATMQKLQAKFPEVFQPTLGCCTKAKVTLYPKPDARPVYCPKRPVAYAALPKVDAELQRLQDNGIISPVQFSDWAAPIVVVRKSDVSVRICGDYSTGLNNALESDRHPLPHPDDIFGELAGCRFFSCIDLSDAYLQVEVEEASRKLLTINTHKGLFLYNRLPPGVKSAPGAFQRIIDSMLAGIPGVKPYLDDILIAGKTQEEHDRSLNDVLQRIREYGFHLRIEKCRFSLPQIKFLGHIVDKDGLRPDPTKTRAISEMSAPTNLSQLRSYLGAINYYGRFVGQMKELRAPLDCLLKKDAAWKWTADCQKSFDRFKSILVSNLLLTHFDPNKEIIVAGDASKNGLGAVILHLFSDGSVKAIAHASRSLTPAEENYGQIEKEALALVFAVTRFHKMIFGRKFVLQTDHKPLLKIFGSKKGIPVYTANRLQRWALTMLLYDFDIQFIPTASFGHADLLSRLMSSHNKPDEEYVIAALQTETDVKSILEDSISNLPVTSEMIAKATQDDPVLQEVITFISNGWPNRASDIRTPAVHPFFSRREGLQVSQDCVMFCDRVVVPERFRKRIIRQLHRGHPGIDRMKSLARSFVYWPNIDDDVESFVRQCCSCATAAKSPRKTTLASWPIPTKPWDRVHIDYAGPVDGYYYLVVVDAYSKWPEIFRTRTTTTTVTLEILQETIARYGNPHSLVSDNGTQFVSSRFKQFCKENGIQHLTTAPYHPQSNGQAERFVDTLKRGLKKLVEGEKAVMFQDLQTFLSVYRSTPNRSIDGKTPADLFLGRPLRTTLDLLKPCPPSPTLVNEKQNSQFNRRHGAMKRTFDAEEMVFAQVHYRNTTKWVPGQIIERKGNVNYTVLLENGRLIRAHTNQLRQRYGSNADADSTPENQLPLALLIDEFNLQDMKPPGPVVPPKEDEQPIPDDEPMPVDGEQEVVEDDVNDDESDVPIEDSPQPVRPEGRLRRLPAWLAPYDIF